MTAAVVAQETVECPACGGPCRVNPRTGAPLWHRPWHRNRAGLHQRGTTWCTGVDGTVR